MNFNSIFIFILGIIFSGCQMDGMKNNDAGESAQGFLPGIFTSGSKQPEYKEPMDYAAWVQDTLNGLFVDRIVDGVGYSVQYKPISYVMLQDLGLEGVKKHKMDSLYSNYSGYQYITLKIKNLSSNKELLKFRVSSEQEYQNRIYYCSFNIPQDIILVSGNDTLTCVTHLFERVYGIAPEATFLFAFDMPEEERIALKTKKDFNYEDKTIILRDRLFQNGIIKFTISKEALNNMPELQVK